MHEAPKALLSRGSEDKDRFVRGLATRLRAAPFRGGARDQAPRPGRYGAPNWFDSIARAM